MATLQASDIADLAAMTKQDFGADRFTQIATTLQDHVGFNTLMRQNRVSFRSGETIDWNIMHKHSGAARNVGLFQTDNVNYGDVMTTGSIPWRHWETSYAIDRRMISMNRDPARIVDIFQTQRQQAMVGMAEFAEDAIWNKPATSTNNTELFGIFYWLSYSATAGFNGGNPTGFTSGAGNVDQGTYTRWANYTANYGLVSTTDLVRKARKAYVFTKFKKPKGVNHPEYGSGDQFGIYTAYSVLSGLEEIASGQNDRLGFDVASSDGMTTFRRREVQWVPQLDNVLGAPFIGIDWSTFEFVFLDGYFFDDSNMKAPNSHNVAQFFVDTTVNLRCTDKRKNFLIATAAPID